MTQLRPGVLLVFRAFACFKRWAAQKYGLVIRDLSAYLRIIDALER